MTEQSYKRLKKQIRKIVEIKDHQEALRKADEIKTLIEKIISLELFDKQGELWINDLLNASKDVKKAIENRIKRIPKRLIKYTHEWREANTKILDAVIKRHKGSRYGDTGVIEAVNKEQANEIKNDLIQEGKKQDGVFDKTYIAYYRATKTWEVRYD